MVVEAAPPTEGIRQPLLYMSLANYAAGAIMMPYGRFLTQPESSVATRSTALCSEFGANVEQVASLDHPGAGRRERRAFFMLRVDPRRKYHQALCWRPIPLLARSAAPTPAGTSTPLSRPPARRGHPADRDTRRPAVLHGRRGRSSGRSRATCRAGPAGDRASAATSDTRTSRSCAEGYDLANAPATRSAPPARSAHGSTGATALPRRPGECWRSTGRKRRFRPIPFAPCLMRRDWFPLEARLAPGQRVRPAAS